MEAPIFWPPDGKSQLMGKDPDVGKDPGQEEKGVTEDEMVGWHHQFNGCELGKTPGDGDGQGGLVCCSPWGHKELNMTWQLNNGNNNKATNRDWRLLQLLIVISLQVLARGCLAANDLEAESSGVSSFTIFQPVCGSLVRSSHKRCCLGKHLKLHLRKF